MRTCQPRPLVRVEGSWWVQVGGMKRRVKIEQLSGDERSEVWEQVVVAGAPNFGAYPQKTDREIPVLRLTPPS